MLRKRKTPMRICLGCQERKPKKELIRIVRSPEGNINLDFTGKQSGRGAYVCPDKMCLQKAVKGKRVEKSLKQKLPPDLLEELAKKLGE